MVRTGAFPRQWTRRVGIGSLVARSAVPIARAGARRLRERPYDLVFFSTTALDLAALGPRWSKEFGVPYVIDLQDPWYSDYYGTTGVSPPGGRVKYSLSNLLSRWLEPYVLRRASHVVSVSPQYPLDLATRYPWFDPSAATVLPFGAPRADFDVLRRVTVGNPIFDPDDGLDHWVYVGRAGRDMEFALSALFTALADERLRDPDRYRSVRLHFVGTSYADEDSGEPTVSPVAQRCGVGDLVTELPRRISYFEALQCLVDADALLVPGSDDPGYTASKLYPYSSRRSRSSPCSTRPAPSSTSCTGPAPGRWSPSGQRTGSERPPTASAPPGSSHTHGPRRPPPTGTHSSRTPHRR